MCGTQSAVTRHNSPAWGSAINEGTGRKAPYEPQKLGRRRNCQSSASRVFTFSLRAAIAASSRCPDHAIRRQRQLCWQLARSAGVPGWTWWQPVCSAGSAICFSVIVIRKNLELIGLMLVVIDEQLRIVFAHNLFDPIHGRDGFRLVDIQRRNNVSLEIVFEVCNVPG